eukprot:m.1577465 g.1577465  ORF g.1577465 m.1577465 type:complete len:122 (+) comp25311_c0_seq7:78-443(+)
MSLRCRPVASSVARVNIELSSNECWLWCSWVVQKARAEADAEKTGGAPSRAAETPILGTAARDKIKETMMDSATLDTNKPAEEATATTAAEAVDDGDDGDQGDSPRRRRAFVPGNRCCIIC